MRILLIVITTLISVTACSGEWSDYPKRTGLALHDNRAIQIGDSLAISVFNETDLSGSYEVLPNGSINMALIGEVPVKGLNYIDAAIDISSHLKNQGFLVDPKVVVSLEKDQTIFVIGEIVSAGEFNFKDRMTVLDAVAKAGGFSYRANQTSFDIVRKESDGSERLMKANIATLLKPGDVIRIGERYF